MSENERRIPGERLISRVLSRGTVRPSVGTPAAFYERFGLADPMAERGFVTGEALGDGDLFSFLSAQPYYAALRAQASWRSHRARRRLLGRIAAQSDAFGASATRTLRAAPETTGSVRIALGARMATESMFTALERPVSREELIEELEAEGWTPGTTSRREAPTRRLRRSARRVASPAARILETVEQSAPVAARRAIQRVRHEIVDLPEVEQVRVVKQLARSVRGPLRRIAEQAAERSSDTVSVRPLDIAADRQKPTSARRKSLRPVMHASPSFSTLFFQEPAEQEAPAHTTRTRRDRIPAVTAPRASRRVVVNVPAVRDARTQQTAGRAGPTITTAASTAAPTQRSAHVTPTARVARRVRALATLTSMPTLRGVDAVDPTPQAMEQRQSRVVRRATVPAAQAPLSVSPTAYLQQEEPAPRAARGWLASAPVVTARAPRARAASLVGPEAPSLPSRITAPEASVTRQAPPRRRVVVQTATGFQYITPIGTEETEVEASGRPTARRVPSATPSVRTQRRERTPAVGGVARAARRAGPATVSPVAAAEPSLPGSRSGVATAPARFVPAPARKNDVAAVASPARRRTIHIATSPMSYLDADVVDAQHASEAAAPTARARRATARIEQRADSVPQVDSRDVALSVPSPTRYVRDRFVEPQQSASLSASPVRRSRSIADAGTVLDVRVPEAPAESPTARVAARAKQVEPAVASRPSVLRDRVESPAVAATGRRGQVQSERPSAAPLRPQEPQRPVSVQAATTRRNRQVAPTGTLAHIEDRAPMDASGAPVARGERVRRDRPVAEATHRAAEQARPVRVRDVQGRVVRKAAVGTGSVVYAAARIDTPTSAEVSASPTTSRRDRVPATSAPTPRRQRVLKPIAYAQSARDFSLLAPQAAVVDAPTGSAPRRRQVKTSAVRIEASRPLTRMDLEAVIKEVSGVLRAIERSDAPRVTSPAARRMVGENGGEAPVAAPRFAPRLSASPMLRTASRHAAPSAPSIEAAPTAKASSTGRVSARPTGTRRAAPLMAGMSVASPERVETTTASEGVAPARRTSARTHGMAHAERRIAVARPQGLRTAAPVTSAAPVGASGGVAPARAARPMLGETLSHVAQNSAPIQIGQSRPVRSSASTAVDPGRGWARRAQTGSGVAPIQTSRQMRGPAADATLAESVNPPVLSAAGTPLDTSRPGTILHALARASSAEDVVRVIMERADGLRGVQKELPGPAVALVERIVRTTDEANVQSANVVASDELAPLSAPRATPAMNTVEPSHTSWNGQRSRPARRSQGAGAGQTMRLANKLMRLVHLAENERRLAEAQRHVRMAQEGHEVDSGKETVSGEAVEAPNMKALQREVFESVLREIELSKQRRQEDFDASVWW